MKVFMKRTYTIFFFIIVIMITAVFPAPAFSQTGVVLRVDPATIAVAQGESFTVDIRIDDVQDLSGFHVELNFNPNHLQVTDLVLGDFLPEGFFEKKFDNITGNVHFHNAVIKGSELGFGSGILFSVHFRTKEVNANTQIEIDQVLTELVEDATFFLIPYSAQDGTVQIGDDSSEYQIYLPMVVR